MNFKTTLVLIVMLVLIGGIVLYDRLTAAPATSAGAAADAKPKPVKLVTIAESEITGIDLATDSAVPSAAKTSLVKLDPMHWSLSAPVKAPADGMAVGELLSNLLTTESKGEPDASAIAAFKPAVTASASTATGKKTIVAVSDPNGVGESVAKVDSEGKTKYFLLATDLAKSLRKTPSTFRDLRLVSVDSASIQEFSIDFSAGQSTPPIKLTRQGETWMLSSTPSPTSAPAASGSPAPAAVSAPLRADDSAVSDILSSITNLRASEYLDALPDSAFANPQITVHYLTSSEPAPEPSTNPSAPSTRPVTDHVIRFGRYADLRQQKVVVATESGIATVPVFSMTQLKKSPADLRDRRVLDLKPADVARIQITNLTEAATRPNQMIELSRKSPPVPLAPPSTSPSTKPATKPSTDSLWQASGLSASQYAGRETNAEAVDTLLESLHPLRTNKFLTGPTSTQPATPWLLRITTFDNRSFDLFLGDTTMKLATSTATDIFEPPTDLLSQLKASFFKPLLSAPFLGAAANTTQPGSQPSTQP